MQAQLHTRPGTATVIQGRFRNRMVVRTLAAPFTNAQPRGSAGPAGLAGINVAAGNAPRTHGAQVQQHPATLPAVQRAGNGDAFQLPAHMSNFASRPGRALPDNVRQKMESFFNTDFSDVQIHVGQEAPAIGALAFTQGSHLYFAPGQYNPNSHQGQQLLGHELTHVLQQRAGRVRNPFGSGVAVVQDIAMEAEADRMGRLAAMHHVR